jgi:flagellar basal-body rod protein FlgF
MWQAIAVVFILILLSSFAAIKNWHQSRSDTFLSRDPFHSELIARFRIDMRGFARGQRIALNFRGTTDFMDPLTSSAASGMRARLESLDMLANNIANSSAPGFKADREFFGLYLSQEAAASPAGTDPPLLPVIERQWTDFAQGSMTPTGSPLDVALNGKGFFVANSPSGPVFTRDGSFRFSKNGELETLDGYTIQGTDRKPILLDNTKPVEIGPDGMVRQGGQDVSQLAIVDFQDSNVLAKRGNNYFRLDVSTVTPMPASDAQVRQGTLEAANFQPAESAVRLVSVMRQFETLQKAMLIGIEMNKRALDEVARVT